MPKFLRPPPAVHWFFTGLAMGIADLVPGISGGTIALICGLYERLIHAIRSWNLRAAVDFFRRGPKAFLYDVDGFFLGTLVCGIASGVLLCARLVQYLIEHHPILLWCFFCGLILSSALRLIRTLPGALGVRLAWCAVGIAIMVGWRYLELPHMPHTPWGIMLSGFLAVCVMLLPGVSGAFLLLLLGMYPLLIEALNEFNLELLSLFAVGGILGAMSASRVLYALLRRAPTQSFALLSGMLWGSLPQLWPWKVERAGEAASLLLPWQYQTLTGLDPQLWGGYLALLAGVFLVLLFPRH